MTVKLWLPFSPAFVDSNGVPLSGAQLFFYAAGSSTKQTTYTTSAGSVANSNPMILDSNGRPNQAVWLTSGLLYKVGLAASTEPDPPNIFIWTTDNVSGINDATSSSSEWQASGLTPTYISGTSFSLVGDQTSLFTVGRRLQIVDASTTTYSTIKTSAFAGVTTITLTIDSGATLTSPLSSVAYGIANPSHNSIPKNDSIPVVYNVADVSKLVVISAAGLTTGTTRTLTIQDKNITVAGLDDVINVPVRQTVLYGAIDSNGNAAHLTAGAGLNFNVSATATPLGITYANGFGVNGDADTVTIISSDASNQGALAASNTNFITSTRTSATAVTWGSTLAPPQSGYVYDKTKQSLLRFSGADASTTILDDYGNTWTAVGNAQIDTAVQIDGLNTLLLDGTGDYVESTNIVTMGFAGWTMEAKVRWNTLPTAGQRQALFNMGNASRFGANLMLDNTAGTIKLYLQLSSTGAAADITGGAILGTSTTWATATTYHLAIVFDALAGKYFVYKDGVAEAALTTTSTSKISLGTRLRLGETTDATDQQFNGAMAGFRFLPYCAYPNGTAFTAPNVSTFSVSSGNVSSDFLSIADMKLYGVTAASVSAGTNPTLTAKNLVCHGEQDTNATNVIATRNYAYKGQYVSTDTTIPAAGTRTAFSANLGFIPLAEPVLYIRNYLTEDGWSPGMVLRPHLQDTATYNSVAIVGIEDRNTLSFTTGATAALRKINRTTGVGVSVTTASWKMFVVASRGF